MDILIIFNGKRIEDIKGDPRKLGQQIGEAAKVQLIRGGRPVFSPCTDESEPSVHLIAGRIPGQKDSAVITIIVSSAALRTNSGDMIIAFKRKAISLFENFGIQLGTNDLHVIRQDIPNVQEAIHMISDAENEEVRRDTSTDEFDYAKKAKQYKPTAPLYSFDRVILADEIKRKINDAISVLMCEHKVFQEWGLYEIQPHPSTALSFYGPSGTGKTMAAEAVAHKLGKKILKVSYADVESKFHGEGPKMVKAIFLAAENEDAVLFFDEADSLLSKRLTNVTQGSEQAINSMRSQLLTCLEDFHGIVIFATNLVINYDQAFLTRLSSIEFKKPDAETRKKIWDVHIWPANDGKEHHLNIPLAEDVDTSILAEKYEFVGREIRNAVVSACVSTVLSGRDIVTQTDFLTACDKLVEEQASLASARQTTQKNRTGEDFLKETMLKKLKGEREDNVSEHTES